MASPNRQEIYEEMATAGYSDWRDACVNDAEAIALGIASDQQKVDTDWMLSNGWTGKLEDVWHDPVHGVFSIVYYLFQLDENVYLKTTASRKFGWLISVQLVRGEMSITIPKRIDTVGEMKSLMAMRKAE